MNTATVTQSKTSPAKRRFRKLRFWLIALIAMGATIALIHVVEYWRGKRAWENCKHELEAKGTVLDWDKLIPPPVPDNQNFFKASKMTEWFVKTDGNTTNGLVARLQSTNKYLTASVSTTTNLIMTAEAGRNYLAWSGQFEPDIDLIREALKRPYARMDGDYSIPYQIPIPNFVTTRIVAQTLAQRAHCYLLLGEPEAALRELTLLHDMRHLLEAAPTGKPMTLVAAMINVVITGLYVDTIADGFRKHAWQESQLSELRRQLADINLPPLLRGGTADVQDAGDCRTLEITPIDRIMVNFDSSSPKWSPPPWVGRFIVYLVFPRGWYYQNMATLAGLNQNVLESFDLTNNLILPRKAENAFNLIDAMDKHISPYNYIAHIAVPGYIRAFQITAYNQTRVNETQIACALELYHLAHGEYPATLDALTPQFIERIPHDIIGGQQLHYRRTDDGKFLLYSIGWNEEDDGGHVSLKKDGSIDYASGDWVWQDDK